MKRAWLESADGHHPRRFGHRTFLSVGVKGLGTLPTARIHAAVDDEHSVVDDLKPHRCAMKLMIRIAAGVVDICDPHPAQCVHGSPDPVK